LEFIKSDESNIFEFKETLRLNNGDYDVLVHPNYLTTVENYLFFHTYKVTVEGYGAKYENFRTERQKIVIFQDGKELILQDK
jgi:hypothetical protein